ncbi:MAG TPA: hypothetical protein VK557_19815 [Pyrinomonadaceae bacterium]|nr:hypothetical protein [Pyrinomonadaceae bacterium]
MKTEKYSALLDDDIRAAFPDDVSVNEALRTIVSAAQALANRTSISKTKRRKHYYEKKTNCRVVAKSKGKVLYETPMLTSSPRKRKEIVSHQRKLLRQKHPELKNLKDVTYELEWFEGTRWVPDKG